VNDLTFVLRAVDLLAAHGLRTWVFGGWGEELRGLSAPRAHADVDLLYPALGWSRVDALRLDRVETTGAPSRRAFLLDATLVELLLVRRDPEGWFTDLEGGRHRWPEDVFAATGRLPVASTSALVGFRSAYPSLVARRAA
jgi:hypothetical protein